MQGKKIAVLAGDGIGPEIMAASLKVLKKIEEKFNHQFILTEALVGGDAVDKFGQALPEQSIQICKDSDAILFGAVGGPVELQVDPKWKDVEKTVLLGLRKEFDLFANLRLLRSFPPTLSASPLKQELISDLDILVVRELVSGIYFGPRKTEEIGGQKVASDTMVYTEKEIARLLHTAYQAAEKRNKKLTIVDKANVLDCSRLWREVNEEIAIQYPEVKFEYMFVDNAAMQLVKNPKVFDVIATGNMFGDILSDQGGAIVGSLGLLPSASLNEQGFGMYEPAHGSAPDIAGKNIANPTAQILSLALMLKYSFGLNEEAELIEQAILKTWQTGYLTKDLVKNEEKYLTTSEFTEKVCQQII